MGHYRKKPVEIEAECFHEATEKQVEKIVSFVGGIWTDELDIAVSKKCHLRPMVDQLGQLCGWAHLNGGPFLICLWNEEEGQHIGVPVGHWIIRGVAGELYPCSPRVFDATYESVE